ncbi:hypothetical protein MKX03_006064 [Papaver bracteatum]|nr:hypothetical protein MKX03_006064 [Papaver bracteatum]
MEFIKTSYVSVICVTLVLLSINFQPTSQHLIAETDRLALFAFRDKIHDPSGVLSSWNASSHCGNWTGVTCSLRHPGRITVLNLHSKNLVGSISPFIGNLSFLHSLSLINNSFTGEIPQEIGRLFRLRILWLDDNMLTGKIPQNISSCTQLVHFSSVRNELVGGIPPELGSLSKLRKLELSRNHLNGTIPASLSNLSALDSLYLMSNNLYGNIPPELAQLSRLEIFQVSENKLSGTIPPQLFNISSITSFAVAINRLDGSIPPNIDITLPNLQILNLGGNRFNGLLPNSISNISGLSEIDVTGNQFTGPVPPNLGRLQGLTRLTFAKNRLGDDLSFFDSLTNCSHLTMLMIDENNLSGQLPDSVANLSTKLTILYMGGNRISGQIPSGIQNLVSLNGLIITGNQLTGSIPASIGKLSNLVYVDMSDNQLSGKIPSTIGNITQLQTMYLDGNRLQGTIPASLSNCGKLQTLWLSRNQLVGSIPKQLIGLPSLSNQLSLSWNHLTGNLPVEVGNLEKIILLGLSNNRLSGKIPDSLEKCVGLQALYLQGNLFEGVIPESLKNVKGLQELDLSGNRLSGRIPEYLESFLSLGSLNLSSNNFEGEVPKQGIFRNISAFSVLGNSKLCGGTPALHLPSCPKPGFRKKLSKSFPRKTLLLIIIFGVGSFVIFLGCFLLIRFWRTKATKQPSLPLKDPLDNMLQKVSYKELLKATDGFSAENLVGVGSYGSVYKGLLMLKQDETPRIVAVKVLDLQRRGASKSFVAECEAMRCIRHRNLVKMLTSCSGTDYKGNEFKALVSEFMPNGNLENWLHPTGNNEQLQRSAGRSLSFMERLNVAIDVASSLDYLHHHCGTPVVHCDLKPSNVLLDDDMKGRVGDFGLAKFLGGVGINVDSEHHTSVGIRGSIGYAAPEYGMGREVSTNGDVYSYGIMVLEMFTGRRPTDGMFKDGLSLHTFVKTALFSDQVMQIVDPIVLLAPALLDDDDNKHENQVHGETEAKLCNALTRILNIGVMCSVDLPKQRMEMVKIVKELHQIKSVYLSKGSVD